MAWNLLKWFVKYVGLLFLCEFNDESRYTQLIRDLNSADSVDPLLRMISYRCFLVSLSLKADFALHELLCIIFHKSQIIQLIHDAVLHLSNVRQWSLERQEWQM